MSKINLFIEPKTPPKSWQQFKREAPKFSIAIDGYVKEGPKFDGNKILANFNHHEKVDRLATRCTCGQILMAIRMNLFDSFRDEKGNIYMNIFANDCDEDVSTSIFLLENAHLSSNTMNPLLNRLVACEDALDTSSGAYPYPKDLPLLKELAWVFEPYRRARFNGLLDSKDPEVYRGIIEDVCHRIGLHIIGQGKQLVLDTNYKVIQSFSGWSMVEETGLYARSGMVSDGIHCFLSVKERKDGNFQYVIGKISPFLTKFDIERMYKRLNEAENASFDLWGGSSIIGGSPRVSGSKLKPEEVAYIISQTIK